MKIGFVEPYDWKTDGGVKSHVSQCIAELERMGHSAKVIAPQSRCVGRLAHPSLISIGHPVPLPFNGSIARVPLSLLLARQVKTVLAHEQFDVVHVHEPFASTLTLTALHASHQMSIPSVATFHAFASDTPFSIPRLASACARPLLARFQWLAGRIAVSQAAHQFASRYFPGKYREIPNGVDLTRFSTEVQPLDQFQDGKLNILYLGRMEPRKGLRYFLEAVPAIRASYSDTRFIVVGDGKERSELEQVVRQQGWADVIFTGFAPGADLPHYYASCDIFCAPSTGGESQGIVLLEAMASGKPIVASGIDGYREVVQQGATGWLVPPRDSQALAQGICRLLSDAQLRAQMGMAGRKRAEEYSWPVIAQRILAYYQTLIEQQVPEQVQSRQLDQPDNQAA